MARPKKEGMDYFPHDTDAVNDEKIEALRFLYGNDGYAFYFILLVRIYRTKDFELDVSDAETIQILSRKVGINSEKFNQILDTCLKRDCFDRQAYEERQVLTSNGIKKRAEVVVEKRVKMRDKYRQTKDGVSDAETTQETGVETPQSKVKESKEKKRKVINNTSCRKSKIYDENSIHFQLSLRLLKNIRHNNPDFKEPNLQNWSNDFRLMMERDKRTEEQITYLINSCQQDSFWKANILSPSKLRKQFDRLIMQVKQEKQGKKTSVHVFPEERPKHWEEPKGLTEDELIEMKKWEDELPY